MSERCKTCGQTLHVDDRRERVVPIADAAAGLIEAMDHVLGTQWRDVTLGMDDGDEVNAAWDRLVAALEASER
mgnify:CR=1 FL=1